MKQLLIVNTTFVGSNVTPMNLAGMGKGSIGFFHLDDYSKFLTTKVTKNFGIALGRGADATAIVIPEVDFSSLTVMKAEDMGGDKFSAELTITSVTPGSNYTLIVAKKGVVRHERNTWTATTMAKSTTVATVVADLAKQFNASSETSGIVAKVNGGKITIKGTQIGQDYNLIGADELIGANIDITNSGEPATLDANYIKDLASRCAADKGFNLTAENAQELYPGYPEFVDDETSYNLYTLRFKVGRSAAKQRDEQVYQIVHIAVPIDLVELIKIDTILGVGTTPTPSVEDGD